MYAGCEWLTVEEERMRRMAGSDLGPGSVVGFRLSRMGKARCGGLWGSLGLELSCSCCLCELLYVFYAWKKLVEIDNDEGESLLAVDNTMTRLLDSSLFADLRIGRSPFKRFCLCCHELNFEQ